MFLHEKPTRAARRPPCCEESFEDGEVSDSDASTVGSTRAGTPPEAQAPRVRFRDAGLAEIVEVESCKEYNRFTVEDRARADSDWRSELLARLQAARGEAEQRGALEQLEGNVVELAFAGEENGSLAVQWALELAPLLQRVGLIGELHGWVPGLLRSAHGSGVLRACLQLLPKACGFIAREVGGHAVECLQFQGGADVLCEMLLWLPTAQVAPIKAELLGYLQWLCYHPHGGQVISSLLRSGSRKSQQQTAETISDQMQFMGQFQRAFLGEYIRAARASRHTE